MASGLAALLDDIAMIAKLAAASIDDVGAAAGKAGAKAAGVVVYARSGTASHCQDCARLASQQTLLHTPRCAAPERRPSLGHYTHSDGWWCLSMF